MDKVIDIRQYMVPEDFDGTEECNEVLDGSKDTMNHLIVTGFNKNHEFEILYTGMPLMYMAYLSRLLEQEIDRLLALETEELYD